MDAVELAVGPACFEARLLPLVEGQVLAILRDISVRKQAEDALLRAMETAQMTARLKSEFLATMSHEIRTPLNAVLGMTSLLECTRLDGEQTELVATVRVAGETLLALVNDVLDLSKLEAGKLVVEEIEFDLRDCIDSTVAMLSGPARAKGLAVLCDVEPGLPDFVRGDPTRLRQVLINLISNAVKFTEHGSVSVRVAQAVAAGDLLMLSFQVKDTGIGIGKEAAKTLFQPFIQADGSTSRQFGGTGLGLAICKRLVEGMGGSIGLDSTPGAGSTFWFTVACRTANVPARPVDASQGSPAPVPRSRESRSVLLVEDNAVNQQVARRMLERLGHVVEVAPSGEAALEKLAGRAFDIVLMDCQMPGLDGFQTTRELRQREALIGRHTSVIAFTANVVQEDLDRCRAAGMDDCLTKPVRLELLRQVLDRWLPAPV
jgi:signal transduction histidine kinase/CheY-like chemotaxis protein